MATVKQLEANRRNAQRSTGPKTQEGKETVRFNAITHGLRAEAFDVLPDEDPERFAARLNAWNRDFLPANQAEADLVRQAAVYSWKLDRADRYEHAVLSRQIIESINACDCDDGDTSALVGAAALAAFDPSAEGERLRRYQFSLHRALIRTLEALSKLRRDAAKAKESAAAPIKPNSEESAAAPIKPNVEEVRQACRTHEVAERAAAPNKANSPRSEAAAAGSSASERSATSAVRRLLDLYSQPNPVGSIGWTDVSCQRG